MFPLLTLSWHCVQKVTDELNDLNKIKSQMVWLLKQVSSYAVTCLTKLFVPISNATYMAPRAQVITAEAKLKMKQKMQAKADK